MNEEELEKRLKEALDFLSALLENRTSLTSLAVEATDDNIDEEYNETNPLTPEQENRIKHIEDELYLFTEKMKVKAVVEATFREFFEL